MSDRLQRTVNKLNWGEKFVVACCYGSAQPKRVLVQKKKKGKRTIEELLVISKEWCFFLNQLGTVSCDMYCLENNQSRVAFVLGYVHTI